MDLWKQARDALAGMDAELGDRVIQPGRAAYWLASMEVCLRDLVVEHDTQTRTADDTPPEICPVCMVAGLFPAQSAEDADAHARHARPDFYKRMADLVNTYRDNDTTGDTT